MIRMACGKLMVAAWLIHGGIAEHNGLRHILEAAVELRPDHSAELATTLVGGHIRGRVELTIRRFP